jgi:hypothetical protein
VFPYKKAAKGTHKGRYDPEDVFRVILAASKGTGTDISGVLEMEARDKVSPYQTLRDKKGVFYPAPTYAIAKAGGLKRKYGNQEKGWPDKPYGYFPHKDGRARFKMCEQDYSGRASSPTITMCWWSCATTACRRNCPISMP